MAGAQFAEYKTETNSGLGQAIRQRSHNASRENESPSGVHTALYPVTRL